MDIPPEANGCTIKVIVYHSRLFKAHWAILVPDQGNSHTTTKIQVTGSLAAGFKHEFQRRYNPEGTGRGHSLYELGSVPKKAVAPVEEGTIDEMDTKTAARNRLEQIALTVPAPGPRLRSASSSTVCLHTDASEFLITHSLSQVKPIQVKDCQYWIKQYVAELVRQDVLAADTLERLAMIPLH